MQSRGRLLTVNVHTLERWLIYISELLSWIRHPEICQAIFVCPGYDLSSGEMPLAFLLSSSHCCRLNQRLFYDPSQIPVEIHSGAIERIHLVQKKESPSRDPFSLQSITWAAFCQNSLERKLPGLAQFLAAKEIFCRMAQVIRAVLLSTQQFLDSELHSRQDFASLTFLTEPWQKRPTLREVSTGKTSHRSRNYYGGSYFLLKNVP